MPYKSIIVSTIFQQALQPETNTIHSLQMLGFPLKRSTAWNMMFITLLTSDTKKQIKMNLLTGSFHSAIATEEEVGRPKSMNGTVRSEIE